MKNRYLYLTFIAFLLLGSCDWLDTTPVSSISDKQYWQTDDQYDAFMMGIHARFRDHSYTFLYWEKLEVMFWRSSNRWNVFSGFGAASF